MGSSYGTVSPPVSGARYRHYQGGTYIVETVVIDRDTELPMVLYRRDGDDELYARRLSVWSELVRWEDGEERSRYTLELLVDEPSVPERRSRQIPLVMITGYAGSGKDSLAEQLVTGYGFRVERTSNPLKHAVWLLDPPVGHRSWLWRTITRRSKWIWMTDVIADPFNDTMQRSAKDGKHGRLIRRLQQRMGGEVVSQSAMGADTWARCLEKVLAEAIASGQRIVVPDGRYPYEADVVRRLGGLVTRVTRPGVGPINGHQSEIAMDDYHYDMVIANDGTLADLKRNGLDRILDILELPELDEEPLTIPEAVIEEAAAATDDDDVSGVDDDRTFVLES